MSKLRKFFVFLLSVGGVTLLGVLIRGMGIPKIIGAAKALSPGEVFFICIFPLATFFLAALRWKVMLSFAKVPVHFTHLVKWTFMGAGVSLVAPSFDFSGQTTKALLLRKAGISEAFAFGSVFLDSFIRLVNNFFFIFFLLALVLASGFVSRREILALWFLGGALLVLFIVWKLLRRGEIVSRFLLWVFQPRGETLANIRTADRYLRDFLQSPRPAFVALAISAFGLFWEIIQIGVVMSFLGVPFTLLGPIGIFVGGAIPGSLPVPGGIGFREGGAVIASTYLGLPPATGLAVILLLRIRDIATLALGGFFFLKEKFIAKTH